ncbi:hypothetical protein W1080910_030 [Cyanophage S-RIM12 isolate W1_08_0910]|uniref:Uncharacterized protein n=4 Tax=Brizovirus TaxID=2733098 RepID=A0A1D7SQI5_9CAUD|nr:hypothetical protein HOQ65_gp206 [Cyanophage S-RIM12 isolate RW_06_0310]YP_009779439.1 hypothetical protein HOQ66_gp206 [Cyanophage S-RIM12 isolate W1_08_0910]AOO15304.1 hypothetical protein Np150310_030 [Cyanophage S-RIM12_Np_15_0310]AOO15944.1 hypothetical protein RW040310_030 [Cyanophage S-RIM12_RW_04_0310]AOO18735.1 hypothetical protein W1120610_029 [Cyanophage S-RIM12_W1_12_0610]AOO19164.1 hypothetical protein WH050310_030 [Cyanophage S-RIM12_WH_05_0310]AOO19375.1 hypothetical protein
MPDLINEYWTQTRQDEETFEVDWRAKYAIQRKDRMHDAIEDYLYDDKVDARRAYEEMLSCIDNTIQYHKSSQEKAVELKELMLGHRPIESLHSFSLGG